MNREQLVAGRLGGIGGLAKLDGLVSRVLSRRKALAQDHVVMVRGYRDEMSIVEEMEIRTEENKDTVEAGGLTHEYLQLLEGEIVYQYASNFAF